MLKIGKKVKINWPGWAHKIGRIYEISGSRIMVKFGLHEFIEVEANDLILA